MKHRLLSAILSVILLGLCACESGAPAGSGNDETTVSAETAQPLPLDQLIAVQVDSTPVFETGAYPAIRFHGSITVSEGFSRQYELLSWGMLIARADKLLAGKLPTVESVKEGIAVQVECGTNHSGKAETLTLSTTHPDGYTPSNYQIMYRTRSYAQCRSLESGEVTYLYSDGTTTGTSIYRNMIEWAIANGKGKFAGTRRTSWKDTKDGDEAFLLYQQAYKAELLAAKQVETASAPALRGELTLTDIQETVVRHTVEHIDADWSRSVAGLHYSRIVEIRNSTTGYNGALVLSMSKGSDGTSLGLPIYMSVDQSESWVQIGKIIPRTAETTATMSTIYELSHDLGAYKAGTLIAALNPRRIADDTIDIELWASTDTGYTWEYVSTVARGGRLGVNKNVTTEISNGIYEPELLQLDDGRLVCFYSDETEWREHSQKIVYQISSDGVQWGEVVEVVACTDPYDRPGMPIVTRMGDGRYVMVYELLDYDESTEKSNIIYIRYSENGLDWGDKTDWGTAIRSERGEMMTSAPYVAYSPQGGAQGTLIVTATITTGAATRYPALFISYDQGKTWTRRINIVSFSYSRRIDREGYSMGMTFSQNGKYLYVTQNPSEREGSVGSAMICGRATLSGK